MPIRYIPAPMQRRDKSAPRTTLSMMGVLFELFRFLNRRGKQWLAPLVLLMLTIGALLVFAQGSVLAPFIYTLF